MARTESAREDLFAELKSFSCRWELHVPHQPIPIVLAVRDEGRMAVYLGDDPGFQFDAAGGLLRAFVDGKLYRTQGTFLACLVRQRNDSETVLQRHDLRGIELTSFLHDVEDRLQPLIQSLLRGDFRITRSLTTSSLSLRTVALQLERSAGKIELAPAYSTRPR